MEVGAWPYMVFRKRFYLVSICKLFSAQPSVPRPVTPTGSATLDITKRVQLFRRFNLSTLPLPLPLPLAPSAPSNTIKNITIFAAIARPFYFSLSTLCTFIIPSFLTVLISIFFFFNSQVFRRSANICLPLAPSAPSNPIQNKTISTAISCPFSFSHSTQCMSIIPSFLTVLIFFFSAVNFSDTQPTSVSLWLALPLQTPSKI